jgi:hypothetical protein
MELSEKWEFVSGMAEFSVTTHFKPSLHLLDVKPLRDFRKYTS